MPDEIVECSQRGPTKRIQTYFEEPEKTVQQGKYRKKHHRSLKNLGKIRRLKAEEQREKENKKKATIEVEILPQSMLSKYPVSFKVQVKKVKYIQKLPAKNKKKS